MKYVVKDYYECPFGDTVFVSDSYDECRTFCSEYIEETDGECCLKIVKS